MTMSDPRDLEAQKHVEGFNFDVKPELPEGYEIFEGKPTKVVNADRQGWWRNHDHYDRDGYCDNPARGY